MTPHQLLFFYCLFTWIREIVILIFEMITGDEIKNALNEHRDKMNTFGMPPSVFDYLLPLGFIIIISLQPILFTIHIFKECFKKS